MFKWLTRNDGARAARMRRRLRSPRGSVFSEFAIIMPITLLICSAIFELLCFWDAQVMANHTAWQVGRIAMVRGDDGLPFFDNIDKMSKTGIKGSKMPDSIKKALEPLDSMIQTANLFQNRANITAVFMMSTCGIGYFGATPGKTISDAFKTLLESAVNVVTDGIPNWLKEMVDNYTSKWDMSIPGIGGDTGLGKLVAEIAKKLIDKAIDSIVKPSVEKLAKLIADAVTNLIGKEGINIDDLFGSGGKWKRRMRQIFGAASRIARAPALTGKDVVVVEEIDGGTFTFSKNSPSQGRMVYPMVADGETTSDGVFVTGAHGWPPYNQALTLLHVQVNWPLEFSWIFPMISGYGNKTGPPVAVGHSIVLPQPSISPENLYSVGAKDYDMGSYTNAMNTNVFTAIAADMRNYITKVRFCMRFRICDQNLSYHDTKWYRHSWKECVEFRDLFGGGSFPRGGDYGDSWSGLTGGQKQDALEKELLPYFNESSYKNRDYFHWDGSYHSSYQKWNLVNELGNAGLAKWYLAKKAYTYADSNSNMFSSNLDTAQAFRDLYWAKEAQIKKAAPALANSTTLYRKLLDFAGRNKVNVHNMVKWQEGHSLSGWKDLDAQVKKAAETAEASFANIRAFVRHEISEIDDILASKTKPYSGDADDPVFDPDDEEVIKDPSKAEKKAWDKWRKQQASLRATLQRLDAAVKQLRTAYNEYRSKVAAFESERVKCVNRYFIEGCLNMLIRTGDALYFDSVNDAKFKFAPGVTSYDIGAGTRRMLDDLTAYQTKLNQAHDLEVDYGALLGLDIAKQRQKSGKRLDQLVEEMAGPDADSPGTLGPGSDTGTIIDRDRQEYDGRRWQWK